MDEESNDNIESINDETEEVLNTEEVEVETPAVETEDESEEDLEAIKAENQKLKEQNKKLFERTKKAEAKKAQAPLAPAPSEKQDGLSSMDTIALIDAKVTNKDDIETVQKYAQLQGISIGDALATPLVKSILKDNAEQRQSAEAANTAPARRGSVKLSDEVILANANSGKFTDDPEALAEARMQSKLKK